MTISEKTLLKAFNSIEYGNEDDCWNWKGRVNNTGRPILTNESKVDGKRKVETVLIQHLMYELEYGEKPSARYMDLVCGNGRCCNPAHLVPRTLEQRFWLNTDRSNGDNGCWLWKGFVQENGYGKIQINGENRLTHRVAYEQFHNVTIPDDTMVLHSCNNRNCINPGHLRLGTHDDNMKDMTDSGRQAKGSDNGNSVLTEGQVVTIKHMLKSRIPVKWIAFYYGVSRSTIKDIVSGRTWDWVKL